MAIGNYLNGGTNNGEAFGFRLNSILKLIDTKTTDNRSNMMRYLVVLVQQKAPHLLDFQTELQNVIAASKGKYKLSIFNEFLFQKIIISALVSSAMLKSDVGHLKKEIKNLERALEIVEIGPDRFHQILQVFLNSTKSI